MHIGLFDSGVGGLTVLRELLLHIPKARYTYLGDTARLPYGNKAPETLKRYCQQNIAFLDKQGVDLIIVACHSASSVMLDEQQSENGTPIVNVISPSCLAAVNASQGQPIGVIATHSTTASGVYSSHIKSLEPKVKVVSMAGPLLVPLVEEGMIDDEITDQVLKRYLKPMLDQGISSLILGCTHYPILKEPIARIAGPKVTLINPAETIAKSLNKNPTNGSEANLEVYLTDLSPHFVRHGETLLGRSVKVQTTELS